MNSITDKPAWEVSDEECPYFLLQRQVFLIPSGTRVKVSDMGGTMKEHLLKNANVFNPEDRRYGEHTDTYFQFSTGHPVWVYMYVPKSIDGLLLDPLLIKHYHEK